MKRFPTEYLKNLGRRLFLACGASEHEAGIVSNELVENSLMGVDTHGVILFSQYIYEVLDGIIRPGAQMKIIKETPNTMVVDCGFNFGLVSAYHMVEMVMHKAKAAQIACIVSQRTHHVGRLAAHVQKLAQNGLIGLGYVTACTQYASPGLVAPWGGREARLGTNPLAYAVPTSTEPVVFDMSTAMIPQGRVRSYIRKGEPLPDKGYIQDAEGKPTTDPNDLYGPPRGSILPFGYKQGHKGFGLALMTEILAGVLAGEAVSKEDVRDHYSNQLCLIALNPEAFCGTKVFLRLMEDLSEYITSTPPAPSFQEVIMPGTLEYKTREKRLIDGIPIDDEGWKNIKRAALKVGVRIGEQS